MEPNYSRHALICTSCWSITRGVTLAFQSPSVCFEICDNQSRLPFVTACSVWYAGKKAWPIAMEEFPCFQLKNLLLCSLTSLHTNDNNCVREYTCVFVPACVYVCVPSMSRHLQLMNVFMCVWQHLVAAQSQREIKQSVNYLERAPVAVTEKRRPNIQDQILFSVCHIMRQLHQAQTTHRMVKHRALVRRYIETAPWLEHGAHKGALSTGHVSVPALCCLRVKQGNSETSSCVCVALPAGHHYVQY